MNGLGRSVLKRLAVPLITIPLLVNPLNPARLWAKTLEWKVEHENKTYTISIDKEKREYSITPLVEENAEKEILASGFLDNIAESVEIKTKDLKKTTEDFMWGNPSKMHFKFSDSDIPLIKNLETYGHFPMPELKVEEAWRKGNKMNLEFRLDSQDYLLDWYKNCGIIFLHERGVKLYRAIFDKIIALDPDKPAGFGNFEEHELESSEELEVTGMINEGLMEKVITLIPKVGGMPHIAQMCYEFENWLAKEDLKNREEVISGIKSRFNAIRYSPKYWAAPLAEQVYENGRRIVLQFEGRPEEIYAFVNVNTRLNPLKEGQRAREATQTKLQESYNAPLLKLLHLEPQNIKNKGAAGNIITSSQEVIGLLKVMLTEYEHKKKFKKFDFEDKASEYRKLKNWDSQLWPYITFLNRIKDKELKGKIEDLPEYKKFKEEAGKIRENIESLEDVMNHLYHVNRIRSAGLESEIEENEFFRAGLDLAKEMMVRNLKERHPNEWDRISSYFYDGKKKIDWDVHFENVWEIKEEGKDTADKFELDVKIARSGRKKRILRAAYYMNKEGSKWRIGKKDQMRGTLPSMPKINLRTSMVDLAGKSIMINGEEASEVHSYFVDGEYNPSGASDKKMQPNDGVPEYFICRFKGKDVYEADFQGYRDMLKGDSPGSRVKTGFLGEIYLFFDEDFRKLIGDMDMLWGFQEKTKAKNARKLEYHPTNIDGLYVDAINLKEKCWVDKIILLNDSDFLYYGNGCALADLEKFKDKTPSSLIYISP